MVRQITAIAVALCLVCATNAHAGSAQQPMARARAAFDKGALDEAVTNWRQATQLYEAEKNSKGQVEALVNLGAAYQSLGQYRLSVQTVGRAVVVAERSRDRASLLLAKSSFGMAGTCGPDIDTAERHLRESLAMAEADKDSRIAAVIWNNLGNLLARQNKTDEALEAFQQSTDLAQQTTNRLLAAKASANAAATAARAGNVSDAGRLNDSATELTRALPANHEQALLFIRCGQTDRQLHQPDRAEQSYRAALTVSETIGDPRATTYALGFLGQLYDARHQTKEALAMTRRAAFLAQQLSSPDALYRWQWRTARLLNAEGDRAAALASYRRAVQTLQAIRHDLSIGSGGVAGSFRETVGPLYFELADLLLQQADAEADSTTRQQTLLEARDTVEELKLVELEDYFQDPCVDLLRGRTARVESVGRNTAVIYIIPLPDRTELLMSHAGGFKRFKLPVGVEQLTGEVRQFRLNLEKRTTNQYLVQARQLYQWLIVPMKEELAAQHIDTLVFVPDGALRTIPMAALEDGEHFLIERFAVAVSPGLTLLAPTPMQRENVQVLGAGLSEAVQNFPSLPYVAAELQNVQALFHGPTLLNRDFVVPTLRQDFAQAQYQIVHFATHGQISRDPRQSFILTYDGRLTLDQLEEMLRPSQFRGRPVELLTLSACQTAAGDDRAALGLAGVRGQGRRPQRAGDVVVCAGRVHGAACLRVLRRAAPRCRRFQGESAAAGTTQGATRSALRASVLLGAVSDHRELVVVAGHYNKIVVQPGRIGFMLG